MRKIDFNDNEIMKIQASTLYVLNKENRIIRINERSQTSPPAIFIGKTKKSIFTYFRNDISQLTIDEINTYIFDSINIIDLCRIIGKYKKVKDIWIGPAYRFNQNEIRNTEEAITVIDGSNKQLLNKHFGGLINELDDRSPIVGYIVNKEAVSVCCSARKTSKAAEASLMTVEQFRGKGLAQKVVYGWSKEIFGQGLIPLYSTSWDNLSSQKVAQKLGLVQYGVDFNISTE
ncbi:GNAT family N-acetyltransferase [Paenibacillus profundus]|nr:GNAT family N-acetyltransferase [Paenibacillus profundus]